MSTFAPAHLSSLVEARHSPRSFSSVALPDGYMSLLLEAAGRSPSAGNQQPWRFVYADKARHPEQFQKLVECLTGNNPKWAHTAPILLCGITKDTNEKGDLHPIAKYDLGQAMAWLTVQATELGVFVHQMGGFDREKARAILEIPEGYTPTVFATIGFLGKPEGIPEELRVSEYNRMPRKPVDEIAFEGTFGGN